MSEPEAESAIAPGEKVRGFPTTPGVYLMKDAQGRVIYIGKAKNLRARAGSYFHKTAARDPPHLRLDRRGGRHRPPAGRQRGRRPADGSPAGQGHPAQAQRRPQGRQDASPTSRSPPARTSPGSTSPASRSTAGSSSTGRSPAPRASGGRSRCSSGSSSSAPARSTSTRTTPAGGGSAPACWLDRPVHRPLQPADRPRRLPPATSTASACSSTARRTSSSRRWTRRCARPARPSSSRRRPGSATRSRRLQNLNLRGDLAKHAQPEVFYSGPAQGAEGAQEGPQARRPAPDDPRRRHRPPGRHRDRRLAGHVHRRPAVQARLSPVPDQERRRRRRLRLDPRGRLPADPRPARTRRAVPRHLPDRRRQGPAQRGARRLQGPGDRAADADLAGQAARRRSTSPAGPTRSSSAAARSPSASSSTSATRPTASPSTTTTCSARSACSARTSEILSRKGGRGSRRAGHGGETRLGGSLALP